MQLVNLDDVGAALEKVIISGDLSPLQPKERARYYTRVCESLGLNPLTRPFGYIRLDNKLTLYAFRDCADQLRRIHKVSIEVLTRVIEKETMTVHVRARTPDGRTDEDIGCVPFPKNLSGVPASNTQMKALTKAKRRVTLSICGLGILDETEVASIPGAEIVNEAGETVRIITGEDDSTAPATKRKSSYAAKKDGTDKVFEEIRKAIKDARTTEDLQTARDRFAQEIANLPKEWNRIVADEYNDKAENLFLLEGEPRGDEAA